MGCVGCVPLHKNSIPTLVNLRYYQLVDTYHTAMPSLPPPPGSIRVQCFISEHLHRHARLALALDNSSWSELITAALEQHLATNYPQLDKIATK
jgi:hypothetical protein